MLGVLNIRGGGSGAGVNIRGKGLMEKKIEATIERLGFWDITL